MGQVHLFSSFRTKGAAHITRNVLLLFILVFAGHAARAVYCTPFYMIGCSSGTTINNFSLTGEASTSISDLSTGCSPGSYDDRSVESVTLYAGSTYTVTLNSNVGGNMQIYVDLNDDFTFDMSESLGGANGVTSMPTNINITIPAGTTAGNHRMRVCCSGSTPYPGIPGCNTTGPFSTGETHDYTVNVTSASTSCGVPTAVSAGSITSTGATISWTMASGVPGAQYVVNTTSADPTGSGTNTTLSSYSPTGLTPATTYYAHVRDSCGVGNFSAWVTTSFTTLASSGCGAVTGLAASGVTNTAATISWTAVTGSAGYKYVINTTSADPTVSGSYTSATSTGPSGLSAATTYYAHVRDTCGPGSVSAWVTIPFTTLSTAPSCLPVTGASVSAVTTTTALISWTAVAGSMGYEYKVTTTSADPTGSGTAVTGTSATPTVLTPGTAYYAHVRNNCGSGNFSSWVTIPFNTHAVSSGIGNDMTVGSGISVYPNPVNDVLTIQANEQATGTATIQLFDISGKLLRTATMQDKVITMDVAALPAGMYIVRYIDAAHTEAFKINK